MSSTVPPVSFAVPGDLHLTDESSPSFAVALRVIEEIDAVIRPDFVQFIGDNVQHATDRQFDLFDALRGGLRAPHFALVGDHDVHEDPSASRFRRRVGEPFGSMSLRGVRFLRLNTQEARPSGMSPGQLAWLRAEIDSADSSGQRVLIFQHNYPYQIWESFDGPGLSEWRSIVQLREIAALVCGHTHYGQVANDGRNVTVAVRSIGDPEGGPPGYLVGSIQGEDLAFGYREVNDDRPFVLVTHPRETILARSGLHVVRGPDEVRLRVWSRDPVGDVTVRVDGDSLAPVSPVGDAWAAPLAGDRLAKGEHRLDVEARDDRGRVATRSMTFMVDPTGRFTAVPSAIPRVDRTAFC